MAQQQGFEIGTGGLAGTQLTPGSLDQVTLNHVIEHLHDPVAALRRLRGWLRPGGRIWLQTPNIEGAGAQHYAAGWCGLEPPRHLVMFGPRSLRLGLERAGFERAELMAPQLDAQFYIGQSEAIRAGREPYGLGRAERRAARRAARAWDRAALSDPQHAESITMLAYRPA